MRTVTISSLLRSGRNGDRRSRIPTNDDGNDGDLNPGAPVVVWTDAIAEEPNNESETNNGNGGGSGNASNVRDHNDEHRNNNNHDRNDDENVEGPLPSSSARANNNNTDNDDTTNSTMDDGDVDVSPTAARAPPFLPESEEERALARRRESLCQMVLLFLVIKLFIFALETKDPTWWMLAVFLTYWLIRRRRSFATGEHWRAAVEERRRARAGAATTFAGDMDNELMLNYQAQLTAAIWESRMLAVMGGITDAPERDETQGVSEDAKTRWKRYEHSETTATATIATEKALLKKDDDDELTCSICLCEYEPGERMVRLPCGHVYHEDCISSWTRNHVRCPLCNLDLESSGGDGETAAAGTDNDRVVLPAVSSTEVV